MLLVFSADYLSIYDDETIMTDLELLEAIAVDKPCDAKSLKCVASGDHRAQTESIGFPVFLACVPSMRLHRCSLARASTSLHRNPA